MNATRGARLIIDDVTLRFGGIVAINGVSFIAEPSELVAMVGPNGAGKTAMLNCINGIYRPTRGDIQLDGKSLVGRALHDMIDFGIGRAFQHAELFPYLTVTENLLLGCHSRFKAGLVRAGFYLGRGRREEIEQRSRAEAIIDFFELYRYRDDLVGSLPYGVQKMVGVARALMQDPKLLLLDEPCTGLIREERENLARFLMRICHEMGPTVIWVEHDMQMVADLADRVIVMNFGAKITEGTPEAIRRDPEVIKAYLGQAVH